ncbi:hypothetical protein ANCCEY_14494 [Ancylostoma ceylanicum]|uniref:Uncharacterized protein n=1 Tax=Ancylostoma ceylanicum TaxID=53326 RepID=A0A0D6L9P8_9BILA|nr:hypothetical protein ANCCEY_14494 [Ancylostoma ceylanicum]
MKLALILTSFHLKAMRFDHSLRAILGVTKITLFKMAIVSTYLISNSLHLVLTLLEFGKASILFE